MSISPACVRTAFVVLGVPLIAIGAEPRHAPAPAPAPELDLDPNAAGRSSLAARLLEGVTTPSPELSPLRLEGPDFALTVSALMQFRYTVSAAPQAPSPQDDLAQGFGFRRLRVSVRGETPDGRVRAGVQTETVSNTIDLLDGAVSFQLTDALRLRVGRFNLQYDRELITSASYLLATERSALSNTLNVDAANRVEGLELQVKGDLERAHFTFSEGLGVAGSPFGDRQANWGLTARYERLLIGDDFGQFDQFTAPRGTPRGLVWGGAAHTQHLDGLGDRFAATTDLVYQHDGFNAMLLFGLQAAEDRNREPFNEPEHDWGMVLKGGVYVTERIEPFVRTELATTSDDGHPDLTVLTAGFNYYLLGQACKFSTDVTVALDGVGPAFDRPDDGLRLTDEGHNRFIWRAQIQLLF